MISTQEQYTEERKNYWLCENCESAYHDECRCPLCGCKEAMELTEEEIEELL